VLHPTFSFFSGIGLYAALLLALLNPLHRIVVVARNQEKADYAREQILPLLPDDDYYKENIIALACDHASFQSTRNFRHNLQTRLNDTYNTSKWARNGIDVFVLNAAVLCARDSLPQFTEDGIELTFQTNYLTPFLLANLTTDLLNPGGRVVISTSGLHEQAKMRLNGIVGNDGNARKGFEMLDGSSFHYKQSYAISKLCSVALCGQLASRLAHRNIVVNCFSPGLMTSSGLFRNQKNGGDICHNKSVVAKEKPVGWGAGALVYMAIADDTGKRSNEYWRDADSTLGSKSVYGKHFCPTRIAHDYVDEFTSDLLWHLSCQLTGLENNHSS
jgi:NAD(P)-dependent dehydrogenase (short-subunit alcohol dehydrogenase family)